MSESRRVTAPPGDIRSLLASLEAGGANPAAVIRQWQVGRRSDGEQAVLQRAALTRRDRKSVV